MNLLTNVCPWDHLITFVLETKRSTGEGDSWIVTICFLLSSQKEFVPYKVDKCSLH